MAKNKPSWHFPRTELAKAYLDSLELGLVSARALFAPRRHGKTEFLNFDMTPMAIKQGYAVVYVNLWDNQERPIGAIVEALKSPHGKSGILSRLTPRSARPVKSVKLSGKIAAFGEAAAEVAWDKQGDTTAELLALHAELNSVVKKKQPTLLLVDEAHLLADSRHETLAASLRSGLDIRKNIIKVVFTGSSESTLRRMFSQIKQPFYNWASIEPFPLLGRDFVEHQVATFNAISKYALPVSKALSAFKALHGVPEYFRRFLDELVTHPFDGIEEVLKRTQTKIHDAHNYPQKWAQLKAIDQAVLRVALQKEALPHSLATRTQMGEALGLGKPVDNAVIQNAIRRLIASQIVVRVEHGSYRFEDAQFAEWISDR
jgi:hypothetical protein